MVTQFTCSSKTVLNKCPLDEIQCLIQRGRCLSMCWVLSTWQTAHQSISTRSVGFGCQPSKIYYAFITMDVIKHSTRESPKTSAYQNGLFVWRYVLAYSQQGPQCHLEQEMCLHGGCLQNCSLHGSSHEASTVLFCSCNKANDSVSSILPSRD